MFLSRVHAATADAISQSPVDRHVAFRCSHTQGAFIVMHIVGCVREFIRHASRGRMEDGNEDDMAS